ncbi:MAG: sensor histidine kinase [Bacteroidota bacterium]
MPVLAILFCILLTAAVVSGIFLFLQYRKEKNKKEEIDKRYRELELKMNAMELETIKYKLNPHLFKNTLNSIQSHAYQTYYALDKLSNVLDYILYESDQRFVSPKEEIEFALSLIEINRLKVSPLFDLRIKNNVKEDDIFYEQKLVAPLITVDLIENAFKHADLQSAESFISVVFELKDGRFYLTVSNKVSQKPVMKKEKGGFGKINLKKRLDIIYKNNYQLDQFTENDVYIAHLKINLIEHKAQVHIAG